MPRWDPIPWLREMQASLDPKVDVRPGMAADEIERLRKMSDEISDFRVQERVADVVAIMMDFRRRRLQHMINHPNAVTDDDKMPDSLRREAEARAILRELNLA